MSFESQITQLSSEQLDKFFEQTPETTPTADTLAVAKEQNQATPEQGKGQGIEGIPFYSETEEEIVESEKPEEIVPETVEDNKKPETTDKTKDKIENEEPHEQIKTVDNNILKNTVDYLVSSGKWVDFEGREDLEITEEVYADLVAKQDEYRVNSMFNELLDSTGDYGKAIITHIKQGGNPDEIIDLFKEQKQLTQIDTSTETGKQQLIEKYYSEVLNWKPEKVVKTVKRLITDNEIDSEFQDVKEMYDKHYQERLQEINETNKAKEQQEAQRQQAFVNNINSVLEEDKSLTQSDKALIAGSILDFRHKLPNGQKVNDFYIKFAEKQADPREYVDLVRFIMDKKGYLESIHRKEKTSTNKAAFNFIKGNAALNKTTTAQVEINDSRTNKTKGTDFSFALRKK